MGKAMEAIDQIEADVAEAVGLAREAIDEEVVEAIVEESKRCLAWVKSGRKIEEIVEAIEQGLLPERATKEDDRG